MTDRKPLYTGEAILLNWTDTKSGRKIVLQLEKDGPGAHPFDGLDGERFAVVIVGPLAADEHEQVPSKEGKAAGTSTRKDEDAGYAVARSRDAGSLNPAATKPKQRWNDLRPSARAALLTKDLEFQLYVQECVNPSAAVPFGEVEADAWLKETIGVASKSELTSNGYAVARLNAVNENFRAWRQARQHGAA